MCVLVCCITFPENATNVLESHPRFAKRLFGNLWLFLGIFDEFPFSKECELGRGRGRRWQCWGVSVWMSETGGHTHQPEVVVVSYPFLVLFV